MINNLLLIWALHPALSDTLACVSVGGFAILAAATFS